MDLISFLDQRKIQYTIEGKLIEVLNHLSLPRLSELNTQYHLAVLGNLNISNAEINNLPGRIFISGDLNICNCTITTIPKILLVGGSALISNCTVERIPNLIEIYGDLDISKTYLKNLPKRHHTLKTHIHNQTKNLPLPNIHNKFNTLSLSKNSYIQKDLIITDSMFNTDTFFDLIINGRVISANMHQ